jgi:hypothetical protein
MNKIMLKKYMHLLLRECGCGTDKALTSNTDGPYSYDKDMLELDNEKGKMVEPDIRIKIKKWLKDMGMMPGKR